MTSDWDLLGRFARENSQDAFGEIVRRHLDLVYTAALRQVRVPQLAEEIAQSVFADLARNASKLKPDTILTAWLYAVTRRTAIDVVRKESRRRLREQIAVEMNNMNATSADWTQIEPLLDDAMAALDETDRSAILLRYFENKSLREVGEALGASEDAAQKRVSRAVERLREFFSKRNVTIGASALIALVSANAVQSAPIGLVATISTAAVLAGTVVSTSTAIATTKAIAMTTLQKTITGVALVTAVGTGIFEARQAARLRGQNQTLQQQQTSMAERIRQLQQDRDDATNQLAAELAENQRLQSDPNEEELLRLRSEVTLLQAVTTQEAERSTAIAAKSWLGRVNRLKKYLKEHPDKTMPEFQFLAMQRWLNAVEISGPQTEADTNLDEYYHGPIYFLRTQAESDFGVRIEVALRKYAEANQGQFPTDLSQLRLYCDPKVETLIEQLYEIKPASILPTDRVKEMNIKTDWVVVRKEPAVPDSTSRGAYFAGGNVWWNSLRNTRKP